MAALRRHEPRSGLSSPTPDQSELIRRAATGDDDAFRALVRAVLPRLRRWALARLRDPDDADEAVQETLIRMHRSLASFEGQSRLSSWLYRILRNVATDLERQRAARSAVAEARPGPAAAGGAAPSDVAHTTSSVPSSPPDPVAALHAGRLAAAVRDFLEALPPGQRQILELVDHQGMRAVDVAEALDMKPATVRAHLFKARRAIRERILERYPELMEGYSR